MLYLLSSILVPQHCWHTMVAIAVAMFCAVISKEELDWVDVFHGGIWAQMRATTVGKCSSWISAFLYHIYLFQGEINTMKHNAFTQLAVIFWAHMLGQLVSHMVWPKVASIIAITME